MAEQALKVRDGADQSDQLENHHSEDVVDGDNFVGDTNMTDAEILLRDWCGEA